MATPSVMMAMAVRIQARMVRSLARSSVTCGFFLCGGLSIDLSPDATKKGATPKDRAPIPSVKSGLVVLGDFPPAALVAMNLVGTVGQAQRALVGVHAGELEDLAYTAGTMELQAAVHDLRGDVGHRHL